MLTLVYMAMCGPAFLILGILLMILNMENLISYLVLACAVALFVYNVYCFITDKPPLFK